MSRLWIALRANISSVEQRDGKESLRSYVFLVDVTDWLLCPYSQRVSRRRKVMTILPFEFMSSEPRTIVHFTKSADALHGILEIGFKIKYCRERIVFGDIEKRIRVPVVSFCDIPITQAGENMAKYGCYALGLTERWATKQGLTPVIYLERHSTLAQSLLRSLDLWAKIAPNSSEGDPLMDAFDILRHTKNYVGELHRADGKVIADYCFGEEREWRYALKTRAFYKFFYMEEMTKHPGIAEMMQGLIEDERLLFKAGDVRYILIEEERERSGIEAHIRSLKDRFAAEEMEDLVSKICTSKQLVKS